MIYTDDENDYNSEIDDFEFEPRDKILNDLKKLSKRNNINGIRRFINIHQDKLNDYKSR